MSASDSTGGEAVGRAGSADRLSSGSGGRLALAAIVLAFCATSLVWIVQDNTPMPIGDSYVYLNKVFRFVYDADVIASDPSAAIGTLSHGGRPPVYQLLTLPFMLIFGRSEDALLSVNLLLLVVLLVSTYSAGKLVAGHRTGLLAALLVATYPPVVQLSRMYLPHFGLVAGSALSTYCLLALLKKQTVGSAWGFALSLALCALMHPNFFWSLAIPMAAVSIYIAFFQSAPRYPNTAREAASWLVEKLRRPFVLRGLMPASLAALAIGLGWYLVWGTQLLDVQKKMFEAEGSEGFSSARVGFLEVPASFWWYAKTAPGAVSNVMIAFLVVGLVYGLVKRRVASLVLIVLFVSGYVTQSLQVTYSWWYISPLLPIAAVVSTFWIGEARPRWLRSSLALICAAIAVFNYSFVTWGSRPWSRPIAKLLGAPLEQSSCKNRAAIAFCPVPAVRDNWPVTDILETILDDPECSGTKRCKLLVPSLGAMKSVYFNFRMLQRWPVPPVLARKQGVRRLGAPYPIEDLLQSEYIAYVPSDRLPAQTVSYYVATMRFLQSPPPLFAASHREVASFDFPGGNKIKLIKRISRLELPEAEEAIAALPLAERYKKKQYDLFTALHLDNKDLNRAIELNEEALLRAPATDLQFDNLMRLGNVLVKRGDPGRAVEFLERAVTIEPERPLARFRLAQAYRASGQIDKAEVSFEQAIEQAPRMYLARRKLAELYLETGRTSEALSEYRKILEEDPGEVASLTGIARIYADSGQLEAAIEHLETAMRLAPESAMLRRRAGKLYRQKGDAEQAIRAYLEALEIEPRDSTTRLLLALQYHEIRRSEEAITQLETALEHDPSKPELRRHLARIRKERDLASASR